jgi:predicted transcriptional regulator
MIDVTYKGTKCVQLPGSEYFVTSEGTLLRVTSLGTKRNREGYMVTRKGTQKYYSKAQLLKLYNRFLEKEQN